MSSNARAAREFRSVTRCRVDLPSGRVVVQGGDGDDASVRVLRLRDDESAGPRSDELVAIDQRDGALSIRPGPGSSVGGRADVSVELTLPREAQLVINTTAADVRVRGCRGGQSVRSVVGDVRLDGVAGHVEVRTVSGAAIVSGGSIDAVVSTTSGRISLDCERMGLIRLRSVSGDIEVVGGVSAGYDRRIESLSGDVGLATADGVTLVPRTVSGRIVADEGARREVRHGATVLTVGDGQAEVEVRSVSGDIRLGRTSEARDGRPRTTADSAEPIGEDALLQALEALARGDIGIEEADRRLGALRG